jgi:RimJ/RimL family protein N-acetyltransferase
MTVLETERLILRPWREGDLEPLARILGDAHVRRFYPSVATREQVAAQIDNAVAKTAANGFHFAAAELKATSTLIGLIGIGVIDDALRAAIPGEPRVEIGWQLDKAVWGQGLAPEGARAWLAHGFGAQRLPEIVAFTATVNLPSQRVMQKIGMRRDPSGDFDHPRIPVGQPLRAHVLYRFANPLAG